MRIGHLLARLLLACFIPAFAIGSVVAAAPAAPPPAPGTQAGWTWPLSPKPAVIRGFDPPDKPWLSGHRGVDLQAASDGVQVASPDAGTVSFAGVVVDRPVVTIDHGNGLRSSFEPVSSELPEGKTVAKGQSIGTLARGHCEASSCLHWGVRRDDEYVNPLAFVTDMRPSVLLPLDNYVLGSGVDVFHSGGFAVTVALFGVAEGHCVTQSNSEVAMAKPCHQDALRSKAPGSEAPRSVNHLLDRPIDALVDDGFIFDP